MYILRLDSKKINLPRGYMIDDITVNVGYGLQQCVSCLREHAITTKCILHLLSLFLLCVVSHVLHW